MWALYCLVQFYNVAHVELDPIRPLSKFISFKAIVFATWWQGVGIVLLYNFWLLPNDWKFKTGMQDFLICIEVLAMEIKTSWCVYLIYFIHLFGKTKHYLSWGQMAIAAVAHIFVFSTKPYISYRATVQLWKGYYTRNKSCSQGKRRRWGKFSTCWEERNRG